jgi:hypothetical protein
MVGDAHPDMVDSCQEQNSLRAQHFLMPDSLLWMYSKAPEGAEPFLRRLIILIFAGWLPT